MRNSSGVTVEDTSDNLAEKIKNQRPRERHLVLIVIPSCLLPEQLVKILKELSSSHKLKNQADSPVCHKGVVDLNHVWIVQAAQQGNLPAQSPPPFGFLLQL